MAEKKGTVSSKKKSTTTKKTSVKNSSGAKKSAPKKVVKKVAKKVEPKKEVVEKTLKDDKEFKRYIYFAGILAMSFILLAAMFEIALFYSYDKLHNSYLLTTSVIDKSHNVSLKDAKETFSKLDGNYFIYVSYTGDTNIYNLEKRMKNLINKYNLNDRFYYVNTDDYTFSDYYIEFINNYLGMKDAFVVKVPTIIYVNRDNEVTYSNIITRNDDEIMNIGDFQKLLDVNGF